MDLCTVPDLCAYCEALPAVAALHDGRIVCRACRPLFTTCERCTRDVPLADAVTVEGQFRYDGFACAACADGE